MECAERMRGFNGRIREVDMPSNGASAARPSDFNGQPASKNKPMPQNIEAEQSVLAACMLNQDAVEELVLKLKPENFYRPAHR